MTIVVLELDGVRACSSLVLIADRPQRLQRSGNDRDAAESVIYGIYPLL